MNKSANRLIGILEHVVHSERPLRLSDVARELNLDKTTASRYLNVLVDSEYLVVDPSTRHYQLGAGLFSLAAATMKQSNMLTIVRPYLKQIRDLTGETTVLHLKIGYGRVCAGGEESHHSIRRVMPLGETVPLYRGNGARVILAFLNEPEASHIMNLAREAGEDMQHLEKILALARKQHYVAAKSERIPDVSTLAVPLLVAGIAFGSISVVGPASRWTQEAMERWAPELLTSAQAISDEIGLSRVQSMQAVAANE